MAASAQLAVPAFQIDDRVRIRQRTPVGHYRTPMYVRGKTGHIERVLDLFIDPEAEGYGKNEGGKIRLYRVRFKQRDLWPDYAGGPEDELQIEMYEPWLERA